METRIDSNITHVPSAWCDNVTLDWTKRKPGAALAVYFDTFSVFRSGGAFVIMADTGKPARPESTAYRMGCLTEWREYPGGAYTNDAAVLDRLAEFVDEHPRHKASFDKWRLLRQDAGLPE